MKTIKLLSTLFISILLLNSCKKEDPIHEPLGNYENGFFVVNEGNFASGNAAITFISNDYATIEQDVYSSVNSEALGDTAQSMFTYGDKAYIILNGSHKVVVVNRYTMEKITVIDGADISNPRFMEAYNGYGYVSNWGDASNSNDDFITVIDLASNAVVGTISVGLGPEKIQLINNKLYVAMKGAWGTNNKITVINANTNLVISQIEVGDNPNSMYVVGSDLYVVSGGISWPIHTAGSIDKIDVNSNLVTQTWNFSQTEHPDFLNGNGSTLYYKLGGAIYKWTAGSALPTTAETALAGFYYGMSIHEGYFYAVDPGNYTSEGTLKVFDLTDNSLQETITTGIIPNAVVFN